MINDLITTIGQQLNIKKSCDIEWVCRVIYSVAGKMALNSLWDHVDEEATISIQHFKKSAKRIFEAYSALYPQVKTQLPESYDELIDDIYAVYLRTGHFYHASHKLSPVATRESESGKIMLHRGISPEDQCFMSGLGFYTFLQKETDTTDVDQMFCLQNQPLSLYLQDLLDGGEWVPIKWPENTEFLRLEPPFSRRYWTESPNDDKRISLARYGEPNKIYVFYRFEQGKYFQKAIPEWRIRDFRSSNPNDHGEYRRIAIALLNVYSVLPKIKAKSDGELKEVRVGYRLPPSEEDFFRLYSWPLSYDITPLSPQVFTRKMATPVYFMFKQQLETIGYRFVEE